jgi:exodeoxyribonuclease VII large subunit
LWAFNDETVARAIAACPIPVVSGVGHEVDFTIADFVADVRAPTPSAAAELVAPDWLELARLLRQQQLALVDAARQIVTSARNRLQGQQWALERVSPHMQLNNYRQQIDTWLNRAERGLQHRLSLQREQVGNLAARVATLDPRSTLRRGYAIVQKGPTVVTQIGQVEPGDELTIQVSDGEFEATVQDPSKELL